MNLKCKNLLSQFLKIAQQKSISDIQSKLNEHGYPVKVDGILGAQTIGAIKEFQKANNIAITGNVNDTTVDFLFSDKSVGKPLSDGLSNIQKEYNDLTSKYLKSLSVCESYIKSPNLSEFLKNPNISNSFVSLTQAYIDLLNKEKQLSWSRQQYSASIKSENQASQTETSRFYDVKIITAYDSVIQKIKNFKDRVVAVIQSLKQKIEPKSNEEKLVLNKINQLGEIV